MDINNEIWENIPGFEELYQASTEGRIKSLDRNYKEKTYKVFYLGKRRGKILKPIENDYLYVNLVKHGVVTRKKVHFLIALTFPEICEKPFPGAQVNHLNEDKHDNRAVNLRWCTASENCNWGTRNKRMIENRTGKTSCKTVIQYTLEGEFVAEYPSSEEAQRQTGYNGSSIRDCCRGNGKLKTYKGFMWKYK